MFDSHRPLYRILKRPVLRDWPFSFPLLPPRRYRRQGCFQFGQEDFDLGQADAAGGVAGVEVAAEADLGFVVGQDPDQAAVGQGRGAQEVGQDADALAGEDGVFQAFQIVVAQVAVDGHPDLGSFPVGQAPVAVVGEQVAEAAVQGQVLGRLGRAVGGQVGGGGAEVAFQLQQGAGHGVFGRGLGQAQGQVDAVGHQVHQLVGEYQLTFQARVFLDHGRQQGGDVAAAEGQGGADAQHALGRFAQVAQGQFGAVHRFQGAAGVLEEDFAGGGQAEAAGGPLEQALAEGSFQVADLLADLGPGAVELPGGGGHAAAFDDLEETVPTGKPGHDVNDPLTLMRGLWAVSSPIC